MDQNLFHSAILEKYFEFDRRYLFKHLAWLNMAYAKGLRKSKIISIEDWQAISTCLSLIESRGADRLLFEAEKEDLILHVEYILRDELGSVGGQLHTGRSRNDMGHTLLRMLLRQWGLEIIEVIENLNLVLLEKAIQYEQAPFPAVTHGQRAQTIPYAHYLLGMGYTLMRDIRRLQICYREVNFCPMGAAALATSAWNIDRQYVSDHLGFAGVQINAYDCISGVDSLLAFIASMRICAINLSRLVSDLHLGTSQETNWYSFGDQYISRSSIMPQKRNPVVLEHLRGRLARLIQTCDVVSGMTHGIPYGDVNDVDADLKFPLHETVETFIENLQILTEVLRSLKLNSERCLETVQSDFSNMTELADWLVQKQKVSFREAHSVVSNLVTHFLNQKKPASELSGKVLAKVFKQTLGTSIEFEEGEVRRVLEPQRIIESRDNLGGTSLRRVREQISDLQGRLNLSKEFRAEHWSILERAHAASYDANEIL